jgi:predicted HicB family RNase H-like nuclease
MLLTEYGPPFTVAGYGHWMRAAIKRAGLPLECKTHGLRKAAARRLAEAGCTTKQIAAITGHQSLDEVERYTREADQEKLAEDAIRKQAGNIKVATLEYKGYLAGPIAFDDDPGTFSGTVAGLKDVVHFEGTSAEELVQAFRDSIDAYLELCAEEGLEPDRAYSGQIPLRLEPSVHRRAAMAAQAAGVSLNQWIARRIAEDAR